MNIESIIRTIPNYPKQGIMFKDITPVLKDPKAFQYCIDTLTDVYKDKKINTVVGIESRGFIFAAALAYTLQAGFVPIRKPGKLPADKIRKEYLLEYGSDAVEIHTDAIKKNDRILLHDDVFATGGTMEAAVQLVHQLGGEIIGISFLVELAFLHPRNKFPGVDIYSLIKYDAE